MLARCGAMITKAALVVAALILASDGGFSGLSSQCERKRVRLCCRVTTASQYEYEVRVEVDGILCLAPEGQPAGTYPFPA